MPMIDCENHGWQGAEMATATVVDYLKKEKLDPQMILLLDLVWDEIEFPIVVLRTDPLFSNSEKNGNSIHVANEVAFNEILGLLQPVCAKCLKVILGSQFRIG